MLLGLAATQHLNSLILRRQATQLKEIVPRSMDILEGLGRFNKVEKTWWGLPGNRRIEFGGCEQEEDRQHYKGRAKDFYGFDELPDFTESQYTFITTWNRSTVPGQRCRIIGTGNPPTPGRGEWVLKRWAAWLDVQHSNPAKPGELRWYAIVDDEEVEVEDGKSFLHKGEIIYPRSRTFIPARLSDNPYYAGTGYEARLQALREPLRSQMLYGDFNVAVEDDPWQVIPTDWVRQAQARWSEDGRPKNEKGEQIPLSCIGVDVARGGKDKTVLQRRYGEWYDWPVCYPGTSTPNAGAASGLVMNMLADENAHGAYVNVDVIGVGAAVYDYLAEQDIDVIPVNFASHVLNMDRTGNHRFVNLRAWAYWSLYEALDPEKGDNLQIPPDPELLADLCSVKWEQRLNGVQMEDKEDIKKRIGRSPDKGDAFVLSSLPDMSPRLS